MSLHRRKKYLKHVESGLSSAKTGRTGPCSKHQIPQRRFTSQLNTKPTLYSLVKPQQQYKTWQCDSTKKAMRGRFQKAIIIDIVDGYLNPGDKIIVRLGDRRYGARGTRVQTFVEKDFRMRWYIDPVGRLGSRQSSPTSLSTYGAERFQNSKLSVLD
jgi:hypothetical protein